jgi:hypothetical protein
MMNLSIHKGARRAPNLSNFEFSRLSAQPTPLALISYG